MAIDFPNSPTTGDIHTVSGNTVLVRATVPVESGSVIVRSAVGSVARRTVS